MPACAQCGFDPDAVVLRSWSFIIAMPVTSLNALSTNKGAQRFAYKATRNTWGWWIRHYRLELDIAAASASRRLSLKRRYHGRQRELDRDNLVGGLKPVVDAFVLERLLIGDRPSDVTLYYAQERVSARPGVEVLLQEIAT